MAMLFSVYSGSNKLSTCFIVESFYPTSMAVFADIGGVHVFNLVDNVFDIAMRKIVFPLNIMNTTNDSEHSS